MKIRPFTPADIPFAQKIRAIAGWNQTDGDWQRIFNYQPDGCFVIECKGQAAGTATTTCYKGELAWIGMVLVDPNFRRRGFATALMEHCLTFLLEKKKIDCVRLDATPAGQTVYEKLGFRAEYELARWEGPAGADSTGFESDDIADLNAFRMLDREAFGADRTTYLDQLIKNSRVVVKKNGYGMIRPGEVANYLGPVVADSESVGRELVRELLARSPGSVFWDIPENNRAARHFAESLHFQRQRPLIRMWTGTDLVKDRPDLQWAIGSPETG